MLRFSNDRVLIIAEIGSNHNGSLETAFELIDMAAECSADIVKFQGFLVDELLDRNDPNYERLKKLEVPRDWYGRLIEHCHKKNVHFLSTATNFTTLGWMEEYGAEGYKVASCNITHTPLIERLIEIGKPLIVSTGMAHLDEVKSLADQFKTKGDFDYAFLHCIAKYPCPPEEMRLLNIPSLIERLKCMIGLSDHSPSTHIPIAAVGLGARIVEKHVSLDKTGIGMDHEVAILPDVFREMCYGIREVEGSLVKDFTPDLEVIHTMRRSVHFARDLKAGATISDNDLKIVRPENGLPPKDFHRLIGAKLKSDVKSDQAVSLDIVTL